MVITDINQVVYQGDGVTTAFPFTFRIIDATDVKLLLIDADGTETDITSDYFVDTNTNTVYYPGYAPGAEPGLADQPAPVQDGQRLVVYRELPVTQEKDLGDKWPFFVIELGLDKLTMILQQIKGWWDRCLKISPAARATHPNFDMTFPVEAGKSFRVNAEGTGFEVSDDPGIYAPIAIDAASRATAAAEAAEAAAALVDVQAFWFDNVPEMKAANLAAGATAGTKGYDSVNDGGGATYNIRSRTESDVEDGRNIIFLNNGNVAELIALDYSFKKLYIHSLHSTDPSLYGECTIMYGAVNGLIDLARDPDCRDIITFLQANNIKSLDFVVISHYHVDHVTTDFSTALTKLIDAGIDFSNCTFYLPHKGVDAAEMTTAGLGWVVTAAENAKTTLAANGISYIEPNNKDVVQLAPTVSMEFLNIGADKYADYYTYNLNEQNVAQASATYNNFSMIAVIQHYNNRIVLSGDIQEPAERNNWQDVKRCDLYKAEHHALNFSYNPKWLNAISPKYAFVSVYSTTYADKTMTRGTLQQLSIDNCTISTTYAGGITYLSMPDGVTQVEGTQLVNGLAIENPDYYGVPLIKEHFPNILTDGGLIDLDQLTDTGLYTTQNATQTTNNVYIDTSKINVVGGIRLEVKHITTNLAAAMQILTVPFASELTTPIYIRTTSDYNLHVWSDWMPFCSDNIKSTSYTSGGVTQAIVVRSGRVCQLKIDKTLPHSASYSVLATGLPAPKHNTFFQGYDAANNAGYKIKLDTNGELSYSDWSSGANIIIDHSVCYLYGGIL